MAKMISTPTGGIQFIPNDMSLELHRKMQAIAFRDQAKEVYESFVASSPFMRAIADKTMK